MSDRLAEPSDLQSFAEAVNNGSWLKENFPEKDWHKHARGQSGDTQWCDGTPADCDRKTGRS